MEKVFDKITQEIINSENVIIMSHQMIDYDGFGSALALKAVCDYLGKASYIYLNKSKTDSLNPYLFELIQSENITYIDKKNYKEFLDEKTLLIVVDTHVSNMVENSKLLDEVNNIIVLDHHLKSNQAITNTVMTYIDSNLSSINEFMTFYINYLKVELKSNIATVMLTGIELDTNNFHNKTTSDTFKAAAKLLEYGANSNDSTEVMKEDKEKTIKRVKYLTKSYTYKDKAMICPIETDILNPKDLAIISDLQLTFANIEIGFVIGKVTENIVRVSARSNGNYNVGEIMKNLGGGGHVSEAACEVIDKSVKEVEQEIVTLIKEVIK